MTLGELINYRASCGSEMVQARERLDTWKRRGKSVAECADELARLTQELETAEARYFQARKDERHAYRET